MSFTANIFERTLVYRIWHALFAEQKFEPVMMHNDPRFVRRVLDVACGPGTNTKHFDHSDYVGIDINERYIQDGRRRHGRNFMGLYALREFCSTQPTGGMRGAGASKWGVRAGRVLVGVHVPFRDRVVRESETLMA